MRIGVNPFTSPAHKAAVRSLYRHLIRTIHALPDATLTTSLTTLVHYRFTKDAHIKSPFTIVDALRQGRNCHALLQRAAHGDDTTNALTEVKTLLGRVQARQEHILSTRTALAAERQPLTKRKLRKIEHIQRAATKALQARREGSTPVLERPVPLEKLPDPETARMKGRIVPKYHVHLGVPFLRYGSSSRQPLVLGRMIRQLGRRDRREWDVLLGLEGQVDLAEWEDEWDALVDQHCSVKDEMEVEQDEWEGESTKESLIIKGRAIGRRTNLLYRAKSWAVELQEQIAKGQVMVQETSDKRLEMGRKLYEVMVGERELAEQEKLERKAKRRREVKLPTRDEDLS